VAVGGSGRVAVSGSVAVLQWHNGTVAVAQWQWIGSGSRSNSGSGCNGRWRRVSEYTELNR
jgi:hypothetical protein